MLSQVATLSAALVGLGIVASPQANALITVTAQVDAGPTSTFTGTNSASMTFATLSGGTTTFNNITISANSSAPGDPIANSGTLAQASVTAQSSTGTGTLTVTVSESTPYTIPAGGGLFSQSNVSRSDGQTNNVLTFQSFVSPTGGPANQTAGLQTQNPALGNNVAPNQLTLLLTGTSPYTIRNVLTVAAQTGALNVNGTTVVRAVPEPSTLVMAFMGVPMLAIAFRRRFKAHA